METPVPSEDDREQDYSDVLAAYVNRLNAGEALIFVDILDRHPRHGPALIRDLEVFLRMGAVLPQGTSKERSRRHGTRERP